MSGEDDFMEDDGSGAEEGAKAGGSERQSSKVYDYIEINLAADGSKTEQKCKFCGYTKVSRELQPTPMARHLILCTHCPHSVKLMVARKTRSREVKAAAIIAGLIPSDGTLLTTTRPVKPIGRPANASGTNQERFNDRTSQNVTPVDIRSYVKVVTLPNGRVDQQCIFCDFNNEAPTFNATLMSKHIIQCPSAPVVAKCAIAKNTKSKEVEAAAKAQGLLAEQAPPASPAPWNNKRAPKQDDSPFAGLAGPPNMPPKADTYTKVTLLTNGKREQCCIFCGFKREVARFHATYAAKHVVQCSQAPMALKMAIAQNSRSSEITACAEAEGLLTRDDIGTSAVFAVGAGKRAKSMGARPNPTKEMVYTLGENGAGMFASNFAADSMEPSAKRKRASGGAKSASGLDSTSALNISMNIMKLVAGCGLPIEMVDSPHFFALIQSLNKEYAEQNWMPKADVLVKDWLPKLYETIHTDILMMWKGEGNAKHTMGVDAFIDDMGNKVFLFSEGLLDKVCFSFVQVTSKDEASPDYVADLLIKRLEATAEVSGKPVEEMFCAVNFDNLVENLEATKKVQEKFPKILMNGCRTRCMALLNADIYQIAEIAQLVRGVESVLNFVVSNPSVSSAYKRAAKKAGAKKIKASSFKVESGTKIGVASDIKVEVLLGPEDKNVEVLTQLITADPHEWAAIVEGVPRQEVERFMSLMLDETFLEKVKTFQRFSRPLRLLTEHFESTEARASWICGAFEAFWTDVDIWCNDTSIQHLFERATFSQVKKIVDERWVGEGNVQEGLYSEDYFLAAILDPATLPEVESLPQNWLSQCEEILSRFYDEKDLDLARRELMRVVLRQGYWGDQVNKVQDTLSGSVPDTLTLATEKVVYIQASNAHERPHLLWQAVYKSHFPHLEEIATRLLVMSTQCGQVERACSRNNLYSKVKNKMENPTVQQLLYCHVNLRMGNNEEVGKEYEGFLEQAILDIGRKEEKNLKGSTGTNYDEDVGGGKGTKIKSEDGNREAIEEEDGGFEREDSGFEL